MLLQEAAARAKGADRKLIEHAMALLTDPATPEQASHDAALGPELLAAVERHPDRHESAVMQQRLHVDVDRVRARFGSWYELFPRSLGWAARGSPSRSRGSPSWASTSLYLPPIHPIGDTNRKGPNNALIAGEGDPGSPWAIGDETGGHDALHPELGTLEDFDALVRVARRAGHRHRAGLRDPVLAPTTRG